MARIVATVCLIVLASSPGFAQTQDKVRGMADTLKGKINGGMEVDLLEKPSRFGIDAKRDSPLPIEAILSPYIYRDGMQWLNVTVTNKSENLSAILEADGSPSEILVDGVAYRWTKDENAPSKRYVGGRRTIGPGVRNFGGEFTLNGKWLSVKEGLSLKLPTRKHSVQAIVYFKGESNEEPSRKVPSNVVHLDATGRDVNVRDVRLVLLGGRERKPLEGMALSVRPNGEHEALAVTTDADGTASLRLSWRGYWVEMRSPTELPYLTIGVCEKQSSRWSTVTRSIHVEKGPDEQEIEVVLEDPCDLILRAVDADTGEGVSGVIFCREHGGAEMWAQAIHDDTVRPNATRTKRPALSSRDASLMTDKDGWYHRNVGPFAWNYFIWALPEGYKAVRPGEEVSLDTSLGKEKAEHTFLVRRNKNDDEDE
ncbi:MAG: hypothetical protein ACR2NU_00485 [Aeoliella sp.]